jgi:hypothetical protein
MNDGDIFEAVKQGVRDAIYDLVKSGTDMPCADILEAIKEGTADGIERKQ